MPLLSYEEENHFENGFRNYLLADRIVNLKDNELDVALAYIRQHMESGVGLWTEVAVIEQLKNWKLSLIPSEPTPYNVPDITDPVVRVVEPMVADVDKQTKAKAKIQSITTIDEAKRILDALCDLGYDKILDTILK